MSMWHNLYQKAECLKVCYHCLSCLVAVHTLILSAKGIDGSVIIQYINLLKIVTLTNLKVVRIMGRCNLNTACSELLINIIICNNRNLSVGKRKLKHLTNDILISVIIRINSYRGITKKGLRTGSCYLHESAFLTNYRVVNVPEESRLLLVNNLSIRNRSLTHRTPVSYT